MGKTLSRKSNIAFSINIMLILVIVLANFMILWGVFGPKVSLAVETAIAEEPTIEKTAEEKPQENRLVIPSIHLDEKINDGSTYEALEDGAWRRPGTSTPQLGGNTVLAGHRFTYQGASIFYNLDKVKVGDEVGVTYGGDIYKYKVREIKIVQPSNPEIEGTSDEHILTLYTCTPLWTTRERLVVIADLIEGPSE